jgi:hypothetical protein
MMRHRRLEHRKMSAGTTQARSSDYAAPRLVCTSEEDYDRSHVRAIVALQAPLSGDPVIVGPQPANPFSKID